MDAQLLCVLVRTFCNVQAEVFLGVVQPVNVPDLLVHADDTIQRENCVFVTIRYQQRPWCHQSRHERIIPAVSIDYVHAVAMAFDTAVDDVVLKVGDSGNRYGDLDAVIESRYPPAICASPRAPGDANSAGVHFFTRLKVVQGADAVPRLDSSGRVAAAVPPPHFVPVRAVMNPFDFA